MIVYHFDPKTKIFTHSEVAYPDPVDKGKYLLPANSTFTNPPEAKAGSLTIWNGSAWEYQEDHRRDSFDSACNQFREVCSNIGTAIGDPDFRGGFDEMSKFQQSAISQTLEGVRLAIAWSAANDLCVYEGRKLGLGQPQWWYECWKGA